MSTQTLTPEQEALLKEAQSEIVEYDPNKDFYAAPPPPAAGQYQVVVALSDKPGSFDIKKSGKTKQLFLSGNMVLKFDSGQTQFVNCSSYLMRGQSELHTLLQAIGMPASPRLTVAELKEHADAALKDGARVNIEGDWEASIPESDGKYRTVVKGMHLFPPDPSAESGHNHIIKDPKTGQEVAARFQVKKWVIG